MSRRMKRVKCRMNRKICQKILVESTSHSAYFPKHCCFIFYKFQEPIISVRCSNKEFRSKVSHLQISLIVSLFTQGTYLCAFTTFCEALKCCRYCTYHTCIWIGSSSTPDVQKSGYKFITAVLWGSQFLLFSYMIFVYF